MKKITLNSYLLTVLCVVFSLFTLPVHGETELENAALARIINVLNSLNPLINEAERQQDKNTRIKFEYQALRNDIEQIKTGIKQKLKPQSIEPRVVNPIQGDYLIFKGKRS